MSTDLEFDQGPAVSITTDNVQTSGGSYAVPINNVVLVEMRVAAIAPDGTAAMWGIRGCIKRATGNLVAVGSVLQLFVPQKDAAAALWDVSFALNGDRVEVRVTGDAVKTVFWFIDSVFKGFKFA